MNTSSSPSPQEREAALFALALEKPAEKRAAFLDVMCEGDTAMRQRLDALLAAHERPETFLAAQTHTGPTIKLEFTEAPDEAVGQTLGRYKLLERVGEGGCGVVYVAEQTEPVRRRVALKVIKLGMDTKQVVARFEAERQALAMMDHPNIAKVLDAGTTETGRPFFVMELVRGIRITEYCDQANLSTEDRLDLFMKVCHAIQHAHQKGIIHRDIKPSNILVTLHDGMPVPKVIDFGIAKATEGRLTDATVYTQLHQLKGDLDWIVMKSLEKDRQRRYDTANGLAADIKRHLANEAVLARPPSAAYKFHKAFRRNKLAFGAATAVMAALMLGILAAAWQAIRATRAERQSGSLLVQANEAKAKAEEARNETVAALRRTDEALVRETRLRQEGEARVYGTDLFLAQQALVKYNLAKARELLEQHSPKAGQTNRPGWEWRYLWQQARSDHLYSVFQKSGEIMSMSLSAEGTVLALGRLGNGAMVLDISNPRAPKEVLQTPPSVYTSVALDPRGALLACSTAMRLTNSTQIVTTIHVQDLASKQTLAIFTITNRMGLHLSFSAGGKNLLAHGVDVGGDSSGEKVDVWRIADGALLTTFTNNRPHAVSYFPLTVSPDHSSLSIAGGRQWCECGHDLGSGDAASNFQFGNQGCQA